MRRQTAGWTEPHWPLTGLVVVVAAACVAAVAEEPPLTYVVAGFVVLAVIVALFFDAYGGLVVGLVAASGLVAVRQVSDTWDRQDFGPALVESLAIVAAGTVAGLTATTLRKLSIPADDAYGAAFGSLGLLSLEAAENRLQEEMERSQLHNRPLTVAIFGTEFTRDDLDAAAQMGALRAVARIVENRASETDVPFAVAADRIGLLLPETGQAQAWERVGSVLDALEEATFTAGSVRVRVPVTDVADNMVGIVEAGPEHRSPQAVLEAALASLQDGREQALGS